MKIKELEKIFTFGKLQDLLTLLRFIKKHDIPLDEVFEYIKAKQLSFISKQRKRSRYYRKVLKCPECDQKMNLQPVNTSSRDQTGDDSKSVWICLNKECMETIYNKKSVEEIFNELSTREVSNA